MRETPPTARPRTARAAAHAPEEVLGLREATRSNDILHPQNGRTSESEASAIREEAACRAARCRRHARRSLTPPSLIRRYAACCINKMLSAPAAVCHAGYRVLLLRCESAGRAERNRGCARAAHSKAGECAEAQTPRFRRLRHNVAPEPFHP